MIAIFFTLIQFASVLSCCHLFCELLHIWTSHILLIYDYEPANFDWILFVSYLFYPHISFMFPFKNRRNRRVKPFLSSCCLNSPIIQLICYSSVSVSLILQSFNQYIEKLLMFCVFFLINELVGLELHCEFKTWDNIFIKSSIQIHSVTME